MRRSARRKWAVRAAVLAVTALTASCAAPSGGDPRGGDTFPVRAVAVSRRTVPVEIPAVGNVEAETTVEIRAQVGGILTKVHFAEGDEVREGDPLFSLDPRPFEAAVQKAEATLLRDRARLENARRQVARYRDLAAKEYVTTEQFETLETEASALAATVQSDEAALQQARLDLGYCHLVSPISGKAGQLEVHPGNLVKANADRPMVVIHRIRPIRVAFSVPEGNLPAIRRRFEEARLTVTVQRAEGGAAVEGRLVFIDNAVDRATGTVRLKALFENRDGTLWPGQFVSARLRLDARSDALVVPSQAVQDGQSGPFVLVVKSDSTIESRPVTVGGGEAGDTVIESGVAEGERVVTDGHLRLFPGARVEVLTDKEAR